MPRLIVGLPNQTQFWTVLLHQTVIWIKPKPWISMVMINVISCVKPWISENKSSLFQSWQKFLNKFNDYFVQRVFLLLKYLKDVSFVFLPLFQSYVGQPHSRFGHYFCSNLYGRAPRGPRGVKNQFFFTNRTVEFLH